MRILILTGGSGSVAIQRGLFNVFERPSHGKGTTQSIANKEGFQIQVLTNAYDDGLSTGLVRRAAKGELLGPSDVRKNQVLRYEMLSQQYPDKFSSAMKEFLSYRFTTPTADAHAHCHSRIDELAESGGVPESVVEEFSAAVDDYFKLPLARTFDYIDFSIANIIYAGISIAHGGSLRAAATRMAHLLGIPEDYVILNEDRSLFLSARTKSGHIIKDECNIDIWGNEDDPLEEILFTDAYGNKSKPVLCKEAANAIAEADLIILSSGTQWTSLIPTYMSEGFTEALENTKAKVIMVMNRLPDADAPYENAGDIVRRIRPFLGKKHITVLCDANADSSLRAFMLYKDDYTSSVEYFLSKGDAVAHDSRRVALGIACAYFGEDVLFSPVHVFDFDDTLVARGSTADTIGAANMELISYLNEENVRPSSLNVICTGNNVSVIQRFCNMFRRSGPNCSQLGWSAEIPIFYDGGISFTTMDYKGEDRQSPVCVDAVAPVLDVTLQNPQEIVDKLSAIGIPPYKVEVRNEVMVCIRPVDQEYRSIVRDYIELKLQKLLEDQGLTCKLAGRSTIEIHDKRISKVLAIQSLLNDIENDEYQYVEISESFKKESAKKSELLITYLGDEFAPGGNDLPIKEAFKDCGKVGFVEVSSTAMTLMFLQTISDLRLMQLSSNAFFNGE